MEGSKRNFRKQMKPLILISNDDGYHAKGINSLIDMLKGMGDIIVCAPESARSGFSRAFSTVPVTLKHRRHYDYEGTTIDVWSCSGTPADCIKMAYHKLCPKKADIVIGGINHGDNASTMIDRRLEALKRFGCEGTIYHVNRSCKVMDCQMMEVQRQLSKAAGVPFTAFDGDQADYRNYSEAQFETRIQGLVEVMKQNKEGF